MNPWQNNPTLAIRYGIITKEEAADPYAIVEKKANRYTEDPKLTGDRNTDRQKGLHLYYPNV